MTAATVNLLGLALSRLDLAHAMDACARRADQQDGGYVCFVNVHTLTDSTTDPHLRAALEAASYRFADGVPLVWLSRLRREAIAGRVCGPDFMEGMLRGQSHEPHGFLGGRPGTGARIAARFGIPGISYEPPMRAFSPEHAAEDWQAFLDRCPSRQPPRYVWVGLGAPKQERWMQVVSPTSPTTMFFGVGAAFDFHSGQQPRAPVVLQRTGLEWAHRLASDPRRLWQRYWRTNKRFARLAVADLIERW